MMGLKSTFKGLSLPRFLEEVDFNDLFWVVKRLSGNDTGLTGTHQVGVYYPKKFFNQVFSEINRRDVKNPEAYIRECHFVNADHSTLGLKATYYNNRFTEPRGTRNEFRITRWGGSKSPVQNVENTGAIFVFALLRTEESTEAIGWVAENEAEELLIEAWLGQEVEPDRFYMKDSAALGASRYKLPEHWYAHFPTCKEIFEEVVRLCPAQRWRKGIDTLLLKRREIEFEIFEMIEQRHVWPTVQTGFSSVDEFIKYANSVANRRKSRTGTSLELNLESIFRDEQIVFETQVVTEMQKKPDFLFPSGIAYHNPNFPSVKLNMLAAKTCCKDRWRQVCTEANRIETKHLFTLQQGISSNQLSEMKSHNVKLVVPKPNIDSFPKEWRESIIPLDGFVRFIRDSQAS